MLMNNRLPRPSTFRDEHPGTSANKFMRINSYSGHSKYMRLSATKTPFCEKKTPNQNGLRPSPALASSP
jgi:hypothetical protein